MYPISIINVFLESKHLLEKVESRLINITVYEDSDFKGKR